MGKHILLIAPNMSRNSSGTKWLSPGLGIYRIAGYLNKYGHHAECFDTSLFEPETKADSYTKKITERDWDIIGFSVLEESLIYDIQHMNIAQELSPRSLLVAGGIEAQYNYQNILDKSSCRICVLGEGEKPMLDLANGVAFQDIPGIVFRNPAIPLSEELFRDVSEAVPYEDMPYEDYWDHYCRMYEGALSPENDEKIHTVRIFTRNYCPMGCKFCCSTRQLEDASGGKKVKPVDIIGDSLVRIILRVIKSHPRVKTIYFTDDNFCLDLEKVRSFCKKMIDLKPGVRFICFSRLDHLDESTIILMKQAGFRVVNTGLESFSKPLLEHYGKKLDYDKAIANIALLKKHGITPFMSVILCGPEATLDDVELTVNTLLGHLEDGHVEAGVNVAVQPFRGSYYFNHCDDMETEIVTIPGTSDTIRKYYFIRADDPEVRELQYRFLENYHDAIMDMKDKQQVFHLTSASQAELKLRVISKLIQDIKNERNDESSMNGKKLAVALSKRGVDAIHKLEAYRSGSVL